MSGEDLTQKGVDILWTGLQETHGDEEAAMADLDAADAAGIGVYKN